MVRDSGGRRWGAAWDGVKRWGDTDLAPEDEFHGNMGESPAFGGGADESWMRQTAR